MLKVAEEEQLVYYQVRLLNSAWTLLKSPWQQGIGTYTPKIPGVKEPMEIPGVSYLSEVGA